MSDSTTAEHAAASAIYETACRMAGHFIGGNAMEPSRTDDIYRAGMLAIEAAAKADGNANHWRRVGIMFTRLVRDGQSARVESHLIAEMLVAVAHRFTANAEQVARAVSEVIGGAEEVLDDTDYAHFWERTRHYTARFQATNVDVFDKPTTDDDH